MTEPAPGGGRTLSRDFKHVRRHAPGGSAQAFNGWLGLTVGLAVGLSVALGVFLHYRAQPPAEPKAEAMSTPQSDVASEDTQGPAPPAHPADNFTFYDILKDQQVDVPAEASVKPGSKKQVMPKGDVMLQAGSFKQEAEAEKMVAKLALNGIEAKIQRFPMDDETWYRVRIGPIATAHDFDVIRAKLDDADIAATPVAPMTEAPAP